MKNPIEAGQSFSSLLGYTIFGMKHGPRPAIVFAKGREQSHICLAAGKQEFHDNESQYNFEVNEIDYPSLFKRGEDRQRLLYKPSVILIGECDEQKKEVESFVGKWSHDGSSFIQAFIVVDGYRGEISDEDLQKLKDNILIEYTKMLEERPPDSYEWLV